MKKATLNFMIIVGAGVLIGFSGLLWAQQPPPSPLICSEINFDKEYYDYGEPIGVAVRVWNCSGGVLYVSKGFSSKTFYLEMRVTDSAGRLVSPKRNEPQAEFPDAPPLPVIRNNAGSLIQAAECEELSQDWSVTQPEEGWIDLRNYYETKLPGPYFAQVQVTPMIFKQSELGPGNRIYGDIKNYRSLEAIKSEPKYVYTQGSTEVNIIPKYWLLAWKDGLYLIDDIAVTIWPEDGKTVDDYRTDVIKLNNVLAKDVWKMYSFLKEKHYLLALFDKQKAINSLGEVQAGQEYPVVVSGMFKNNTYFGGGQKIQVIKIFR